MLPKQPGAAASHSERAVFDSIKTGLSSEWIALHSLGLTMHPAKPWAEIDFVLVGPTGVYCLEIKGGIVSRDEGVWFTTPRHGSKAGQRQQLKESPFQQVGSAAAQLFRFLESTLPKIVPPITGYAVVLPDVEWTATGPDVDSALVCDQTDMLRPFAEFMARVTRRWNERLASTQPRRPETLGRVDKQMIVNALRADFMLVPSLTASAESVNQDLLRLTDEQCELFGRLRGNDRVLAQGGAGTGKTLIAVEDARQLAALGYRVLYTCFNRNLATHVSRLLSDCHMVTVSTLHAFMMNMVDATGRLSDLPDVSQSDIMSLFLPELALEIILDETTCTPFDAVIVDEGQDLMRENYLDVIEALAGGDLRVARWRVFLDPNQNIYGGIDPRAIGRLRAAGPVEWPLTINCRNTGPIATHVALMSGIPPQRTLSPDGPAVQTHWYGSTQQQEEMICTTLTEILAHGFAPERIVVLSRYRMARSGAARCDITLHDVSTDDAGSGRAGSTFPTSAHHSIMFSTVSSFKGLESDVVLLIDIDDLSSPGALASVYIGASRAKVALHVLISSTEKENLRILAGRYGEALMASEIHTRPTPHPALMALS